MKFAGASDEVYFLIISFPNDDARMGSKASTPHLSLLQCVEFLGVKVGFEGRAFKVLELNFETVVQD